MTSRCAWRSASPTWSAPSPPAHIHCCTAAAGSGTAGVATPVPSFPGFPSGVSAGSYDQTFDLTLGASWNAAFINANGGTTGTAFSALATGLADGRAYLNIHTSFAGSGEIRGFLAPVPEPGSLALMAAGAGPGRQSGAAPGA